MACGRPGQFMPNIPDEKQKLKSLWVLLCLWVCWLMSITIQRRQRFSQQCVKQAFIELVGHQQDTAALLILFVQDQNKGYKIAPWSNCSLRDPEPLVQKRDFLEDRVLHVHHPRALFRVASYLPLISQHLPPISILYYCWDKHGQPSLLFLSMY